MDDNGLQAALPREMYVDEGTWRTEREAVLFGDWFCLGRVDDLGLAEPRRAMTADVAGESVLVTSDEGGVLHAAYNVCRHRGCQLRPPGQPAGEASAIRCPYHSWTYDLDGRLLRSPHAEVEAPEDFALHPVGVETWGGFVFVHLTPDRAQPLAGQVAHAEATLANYGLAGLVTGRVLELRRRGPTTRCCSRTTTSATTAAPCTPSCPGWCRRSPAVAAASTGTRASRTARARGRSRRPGRPTARRCPGSTRTSGPATRATSSTPT